MGQAARPVYNAQGCHLVLKVGQLGTNSQTAPQARDQAPKHLSLCGWFKFKRRPLASLIYLNRIFVPTVLEDQVAGI